MSKDAGEMVGDLGKESLSGSMSANIDHPELRQMERGTSRSSSRGKKRSRSGSEDRDPRRRRPASPENTETSHKHYDRGSGRQPPRSSGDRTRGEEATRAGTSGAFLRPSNKGPFSRSDASRSDVRVAHNPPSFSRGGPNDRRGGQVPRDRHGGSKHDGNHRGNVSDRVHDGRANERRQPEAHHRHNPSDRDRHGPSDRDRVNIDDRDRIPSERHERKRADGARPSLQHDRDRIPTDRDRISTRQDRDRIPTNRDRTNVPLDRGHHTSHDRNKHIPLDRERQGRDRRDLPIDRDRHTADQNQPPQIPLQRSDNRGYEPMRTRDDRRVVPSDRGGNNLPHNRWAQGQDRTRVSDRLGQPPPEHRPSVRHDDRRGRQQGGTDHRRNIELQQPDDRSRFPGERDRYHNPQLQNAVAHQSAGYNPRDAQPRGVERDRSPLNTAGLIQQPQQRRETHGHYPDQRLAASHRQPNDRSSGVVLPDNSLRQYAPERPRPDSKPNAAELLREQLLAKQQLHDEAMRIRPQSPASQISSLTAHSLTEVSQSPSRSPSPSQSPSRSPSHSSSLYPPVGGDDTYVQAGGSQHSGSSMGEQTSPQTATAAMQEESPPPPEQQHHSDGSDAASGSEASDESEHRRKKARKEEKKERKAARRERKEKRRQHKIKQHEQPLSQSVSDAEHDDDPDRQAEQPYSEEPVPMHQGGGNDSASDYDDQVGGQYYSDNDDGNVTALLDRHPPARTRSSRSSSANDMSDQDDDEGGRTPLQGPEDQTSNHRTVQSDDGGNWKPPGSRRLVPGSPSSAPLLQAPMVIDVDDCEVDGSRRATRHQPQRHSRSDQRHQDFRIAADIGPGTAYSRRTHPNPGLSHDDEGFLTKEMIHGAVGLSDSGPIRRRPDNGLLAAPPVSVRLSADSFHRDRKGLRGGNYHRPSRGGGGGGNDNGGRRSSGGPSVAGLGDVPLSNFPTFPDLPPRPAPEDGMRRQSDVPQNRSNNDWHRGGGGRDGGAGDGGWNDHPRFQTAGGKWQNNNGQQGRSGFNNNHRRGGGNRDSGSGVAGGGGGGSFARHHSGGASGRGGGDAVGGGRGRDRGAAPYPTKDHRGGGHGGGGRNASRSEDVQISSMQIMGGRRGGRKVLHKE